MSKHISIEGLDGSDVMAVLFLNSLRYTADPPHTEELLRAMDFSNGTRLDPTLYDKAHHEGYAAEIIDQYRRTGRVERFSSKNSL